MKPFCNKWAVSLASALAGMVMGGAVLAQTGDISSQESASSATLAAYQQEQEALVQEWQTLVSQGATQQQLDVWLQQNAMQLQAQQQLAQILALESALQPMPVITSVDIPANASSTLQDFLMGQASLANAGAQIYNQLLQAMPSAVTEQDIDSMEQQKVQLFQQQYAGDLQLQAQRAQILAAESASQPIPVPEPPVIPPDAPPQLQAYLTARNALATERAQLWNQYAAADPAVRQAAMQQWQQQNAGRLEQLSEMAQELSNSTANQEGTNQ